MIKVLIDTDILLDVVLGRQEFFKKSANILDLAEKAKIKAFIAWHSISNFYYITESETKSNIQFIKELLRFVKISPIKTVDVFYAIELNFNDFEDALQVAAAKACNAQHIITRNIKHYNQSPIPATTPQSFLESSFLSG